MSDKIFPENPFFAQLLCLRCAMPACGVYVNYYQSPNPIASQYMYPKYAEICTEIYEMNCIFQCNFLLKYCITRENDWTEIFRGVYVPV